MTNSATPKKPETLEEYIEDRDSHPSRGKINGRLVAKTGSVELRGKIPKPLYDKMIYITRTFSMGKAEAAQNGALEAIEKICSQEAGENFLKWQPIKYDGPYRLFRGNVPIGLYEAVVGIFEEKGYSPNDMATIIISCFVSKNQIIFKKRIEQLKQEFDATEEEICEAFANDAKKIARDKKIAILQAGGELSDIDKEKMD